MEIKQWHEVDTTSTKERMNKENVPMYAVIIIAILFVGLFVFAAKYTFI